MNYDEQLQALLQANTEGNTTIKYVPGKNESGWLSDDTRNELTNMFAHNPMFQNMDKHDVKPKATPSIQDFRDGMGSKNKNVAKHELIIDNEVLNGSLITRTYVRSDLQDKVLPALIYVHGGAFYGGSALAVDNVARALADFGPYRVYNLEYPLAPEHPYPSALLSCYNLLKYLTTHAKELRIDPNKIYMSGDSAGGNLTLATAILDHIIFRTKYLTRTVLYYPDVTMVKEEKEELCNPDKFEAKEMEDQIKSFIKFFSTDDLAERMYANQHDLHNPLLSPLNAKYYEELPATEVIVGEFDPLRFQGQALVDKLNKNGVESHFVLYNGMSHAFLDSIGYYPQAEDSIKEAVKFLNK
ncbi:acetyl esterase/lipase [Lactobacillus colini]|uniref:Acetyl esterase/lipase n=1 Tax=Lactobacillus colini TaxID=1819254 RepID=A0ABS4MEY6_9LACO|nr:alpha/beta hydrolase [Lactobacillus colini]MBP2058252.1 acetyl esterase/lipase [Lactobacillus colini]